MIKKYFRATIPPLAWTISLIDLFEDLKVSITSSPILAKYDKSKPTFLKTDWSAEGMGWILMQPADDNESVEATKQLQSGGKCLFDLTLKGVGLKPIGFGSRASTALERKYQSMVGETVCGRWAISQNKTYLWGSHFYWMCDCTAVKEPWNMEGILV